MEVKLTNAALASVSLQDVGPVTSPKQTRQGKTLPYNVTTALEDDAATKESFTNGELAKQIAAGNVIVITKSAGVTQRFNASFTATAAQTVFNMPAGMSFDTARPGMIDVYQEGLLLAKSGDYTVTDADTITLAVGATVGDKMQFIWYK